jgi:hypothetical protein
MSNLFLFIFMVKSVLVAMMLCFLYRWSIIIFSMSLLSRVTIMSFSIFIILEFSEFIV